jgi:hypothetical protein
MSTTSTVPGYYTTAEAAGILDRDVSQVCRYVKAGLLNAIDLGNRLLIEQAEVHGFTHPLRGNPQFRRNAKEKGKS